MKKSIFAALAFLSVSAALATTVWDFSNAASRLSAASGPGTMSFFDPGASGWAGLIEASGSTQADNSSAETSAAAGSFREADRKAGKGITRLIGSMPATMAPGSGSGRNYPKGLQGSNGAGPAVMTGL